MMPFAAGAQNKGSTRDKNLKGTVEFEQNQLDEKAILERRNRQIQGVDENKNSGTKAQTGQSTVISSPLSPIEQAIAELDQSNEAIIEALNGLSVLGSMKADFALIQNEKSTKRRMRSIKQYQNRYNKPYRQAIRIAGVDLEGIVKKLNAQMPDAVFSVMNGTHIVDETRKSSRKKPPTQNYTTRSIILTDDDFYYNSEGSCALIAGSGSGFTNGELRSGANAIAAGGCTRSSVATHEFDRLSDFVGMAKFDSYILATAGSVIGSSGATSSVSHQVFSGYEFFSCTAVAPIFWLANCQIENRNFTASGNFGNIMRLSTRNFVIGALGVSTTNARVGLKDSIITIDERP